MPRKQKPSDLRNKVNEQIRGLRLTNTFWKNVPVFDATMMICLFPQKPDVEDATPGDPENCAYARCIKRVWPHARRVRIWRNVALVETTNNRGETIAERYIISSKGKRALKNLDLGVGTPQPCSLLPPTPSTTLEGMREKSRRTWPKRAARKIELTKQRRKEQQQGIYNPGYTTKHKADFL